MNKYPGKFSLKDRPVPVAVEGEQLKRLGQRADVLLEELKVIAALKGSGIRYQLPVAFWPWSK